MIDLCSHFWISHIIVFPCALIAVCMLSHVQLFVTPWSVTHQGFFRHGISQARMLAWVPFPSPGNLPDPGIEPASPAMAGRFFPTEPPGKPSSNSCDGLSLFSLLLTVALPSIIVSVSVLLFGHQGYSLL